MKTILSNPFRLKRHQRKVAALFMLVCFLPTATLALPNAPQVASGAAAVSASGNAMTITNSANAIINWQSFSIGQGESARFIQSSAASSVLNRITGGDPSRILGALQSNGKVLLINPNGILFGPNSRVDVNGLIASTLNISNQDFLAGRMSFNAGPVAGKIENQGTITTPGGGSVYLIASDVTNTGVITAPNGDVLLAAGKEVLLVDKNSPEIALVVSAPEHQAINLGTLVADAGRVGMYGGIVRQKGRISADSAVRDASGRIFLKATKAIELDAAGTISADGLKGGQIIVKTEENGKISGTLTARGSISAQGDGSMESGGFIETSAAKVDLNDIRVRTNGGNWLIDPTDGFTIAASGGDISGTTLSGDLNGSNIGILSSSGTGSDGNINVNDTVSWSANKLTLTATNNININANLNGSGTASLALEYGQGAVAAGNTNGYKLATGTQVNLPAGPNFSTRLGSDGTVKNYTVITSLGLEGSVTTTDLQGMNGGLTLNYALGGNIDACATSGCGTPGNAWNAGAGFVPIGNATTKFTGVFDGLGHTITGLTINRSDTDYVGLFGCTDFGSIIKNVGLVGGSVTGSRWVGGLVGENLSDAIDNSYNTGSVTGTSSGYSYVGGLVGADGGVAISNSYSTGSVTGTGGGYAIGGLMGVNACTLSNSYSTGSVAGSADVGGLVGNNWGSIINSYSTGSVSAGTSVGGLVGWNNNGRAVTNSYSTGSVSGGGSLGGLVGYNDGGTITNSYWDKDTSGQPTVGIGGGTNTGAANGLFTTLMMQSGAGKIDGFDTNTWGFVANTAYPYLKSFFPNGPQVVSGAITNYGSPTKIILVNNGNKIGYANMGANGFYYAALPANTLAAGDKLLAWAVPTGTTTPGGLVALTSAGHNTGLDYVKNALTLTAASGTLDTAALVTAKGSIVDSNIPYTVSGSDVALGIASDVTGLLFRGAGSFNVTDTGSNIATLAASNIGSLNFTNSGSLSVGSVGGVSGITSSSDIVLTSIGGGLTATGDLSGTNVNLTAAGNFSPAGNVSATNNLVLDLTGSGSKFTRAASKTIGGTASTTIKADKMDISAAVGTLGASGSTVTLLPKTGGRSITLGTDTPDLNSDLELSTNELNKVTAGSLWIGDNQNGPLSVGAAIAPTGTTTLYLGSGSTVGQVAAGTISVANLAVKALGNVDLSTATNSVTNIAASLGDGSNLNKNFKFKNSGALNVATVAGIPGIASSISGVYTGAPEAVISLTSGGALTQSAGAYLAGKAVYAKGITVDLSISNPTGVIAGEATGGSFQYKSSSSIFATTVDGAAGIQNTGSGGDIVLTGAGIGQDAPLSTKDVAGGGGFGLSLTSNGTVTLQHAGNNVAAISADLSSGPDPFSFKNSENLTVNDVNTDGNFIDLQVPATKSVTVNGSLDTGTGANSILKLSGGGITYNAAAVTNNEEVALWSTDPAQGITLSGGVVGTANTKMIDLVTDKLTLSGGTAMVGATAGNGISISPYTAGTSIVVGAVGAAGPLYITDTSTATFNSPDFAIGSETGNANSKAVSGAISVDSAISRPAGRVGLLSGAGVTQTASITATSLGVMAGGAVNLSTPNQVANLAIKTSTGAIDFANSSALNIASMTGGNVNIPTTITGLKSVGGGNITVSASAGNISLESPIVTDTTVSTVKLQASAGAIVDANSTGVTVTGKGLDASASGIGTIAVPLKTQVTYLKAVNSTSGDISILNTGALTTDAATAVSNPTGKISITAQSPLTIGAAGVSAGSDITLKAGGPTWVTDKTGDNLTIDGPVTSSAGNIVLTAGNSISGSGVLTASGGTVTKTANQNPTSPPPPPTLAECTADPTLSGCAAVLPSLSTCTATPTTLGCTAVLPSLATCTATPTAAGCTAVLPSLATCTATPTVPGCTAVLPSLATCTATPTAAGCTAVLPSLDACTVTPTAAGCTAVLPSLATCTATPTTPGCTVVLPSLATCTATPTALGCTAVLPSLATCTVTPTALGCTVVLPSLATCTVTPTAAGCTAVLPSLEACTATPTTAGCTAVLPSLATCTTTPTAAGCTAVLPSLAICTATPTAPGCSVVLPSLETCTATPTAPGCTAVLPNLTTCTSSPGTAGCSAVLPSLATCTASPSTAGCTVVLPSLATCTSSPGTAGCSAVLPSLATCTASPSTAGCTVVLPSLATCTSSPGTAGCSAVLPSLATCTASPSTAGCTVVLPSLATCTSSPGTAGCSAVLPSLATCTASPSTAGCTVVLPSLATCTSSPGTAGCSAVLPSLATCTASPSTAGCTVVLPSLATCTSSPGTAGCSAVLPSLATCTASPSTAGCTVVLPSLATCTSSPGTAGCSAVLPSLATCTASPSTAGCTVVLPSLATCTGNPGTAGCSAVLPSLATCTASPSTAGCTVVLPSLATCTSSPGTAGCSAVLPSLATCTTSPSTAGCTVVLPSLASCTATPTAPGCTVVLPSLATCTATPTASGCTAVLPSLTTCTATPTAPGCAAVLPTVAICSTNPATPGCSVVLPTATTTGNELTTQVVKDTAVIETTPVAPTGLMLVSLSAPQDEPAPTPAQSGSDNPSGQTGSQAGDSGDKEKDKDGKDKDDKDKDSTEQQPSSGDKKDVKSTKNYCN